MWLLVLLLSLASQVTSFDTLEFIADILNSTRFAGVTTCEIEILRVIDEFKNGSAWAARMLDSTAKLQSGIIEGNFAHLGFFDECLKAYDPDHNIHGKYCVATLNYSKVVTFADRIGLTFLDNEMYNQVRGNKLLTLIWGFCIPDGCSADEMRGLVFDSLNFTEFLCQTADDTPDVTIGDLNAVGILTIISSLIIASTIYDLYLHNAQEKPVYKFLLIFSFWTNGKKLLSISTNPDQLKFINGIRTISIIWVVVGHMYCTLYVWPASNINALLHFMSLERSMFIVGATVSVDTFFLLSGMLVTYVFMMYERKKVKFNVLLFYLHRYLRLTPSLAIVILINATVMKHMGSGPLWPFGIKSCTETCQKYWWTSFLYIQNWINPDEVCVAVSWYLSVDTQLFFLSPLLLIPLMKYPKSSLFAAFILSCCSTAMAFYIAWLYELRAIVNSVENDSLTYTTKYYMQTYTRASPWFIGIILGYFTFRAKYVHKNIKINKFVVSLLWLVSLFMLLACVFGGHRLLFRVKYNRLVHSAFIAFNRSAWAVAVSWIIYACSTGYGGYITTFLSNPIFEVFGKISYSIYLLHYSIFTLILLNRRTSFYFSNIDAAYNFWAHFIVISALAFVWTLAFESPVVALQEYLRDSSTEKQKPSEPETIQVEETSNNK